MRRDILILIDKTGHMVSTENEKELHKFAEKLKLKRSWYQEGKHPHYDLSSRKIYAAIAEGARRVESKELVRRAWWRIV